MTYKDKGSYESSPPCIPRNTIRIDLDELHLYIQFTGVVYRNRFTGVVHRNRYVCIYIYEFVYE